MKYLYSDSIEFLSVQLPNSTEPYFFWKTVIFQTPYLGIFFLTKLKYFLCLMFVYVDENIKLDHKTKSFSKFDSLIRRIFKFLALLNIIKHYLS